MGNRVIFAAKPPTEDVERTFDFTSLLAEGEELAAAEISVSVFSGADSSPADLLSGSPVIDSPRVTQAFQGGSVGATYTVLCLAGTCNDQLHSLAAYLSILRGARV